MTVAMLMYNTVQVSKSRLFLVMGKNFNQSYVSTIIHPIT